MVKIVGRDESLVKRVTCKGCACILEYNLSEVTRIQDYEYGGIINVTELLECPNCHHKVIISSQ